MTEPFQLAHTSFSTLSSLLYCGKRWQLEKVRKVPQTPTWAQIAGSAFHTWSEDYDRGEGNEAFSSYLAAEVDKQGTPANLVVAVGKTKTNPVGQDFAYWLTEGARIIELYKDWQYGCGLEIEGYPDDADNIVAAIEVELHEQLDFSLLPFRGYVDRVYTDLIVDIKTSKALPKTGAMQLGMYRAGLLAKYGEAPESGAYYMAREGKLSKPYDLKVWTPDYAGKILDMARRGINAEVFIPQVSFSCNSCGVRDACYSVGGKDSVLYDDLNPDYRGADA